MTSASLLALPKADHSDGPRAAQVERWLVLTREILPGMAAEENWPIRFDHCFMRVCLDDAMGRPWTEVVRRPAITTKTHAQLASAIKVAERIVAHPDTLPVLNARSLRWRRQAKRLR